MQYDLQIPTFLQSNTVHSWVSKHQQPLDFEICWLQPNTFWVDGRNHVNSWVKESLDYQVYHQYWTKVVDRLPNRATLPCCYNQFPSVCMADISGSGWLLYYCVVVYSMLLVFTKIQHLSQLWSIWGGVNQLGLIICCNTSVTQSLVMIELCCV